MVSVVVSRLLQHFNNVFRYIQNHKVFCGVNMGAVLSKMPERLSATDHSVSNVYSYRRRVYEVQSPCQWLEHCFNGKCPAFQRINGNFYCVREGIR